MTWEQIIQLILAIIGPSGLIIGVIALLKVRPESGQIVVNAAEGAVIVQAKVIEQLRSELERLRVENVALREEIRKLRDEINNLSTIKV